MPIRCELVRGSGAVTPERGSRGATAPPLPLRRGGAKGGRKVPFNQQKIVPPFAQYNLAYNIVTAVIVLQSYLLLTKP